MNDPPANPSGASVPGIMVASPDGAEGEMIGSMLGTMGMRAAVCTERSDAEARLGDPNVGLAIVDMGLLQAGSFSLLRRARPRLPELRLILLAGQLSTETAAEAIRLGVCGCLIRPLSFGSFEAEVRRVLAIRELEVRSRDSHTDLQEELERRTREVLRRQGVAIAYERSLINALCRLAEFRDPETGEHIHRMADYSREIAVGLREDPIHRSGLDDLFLRRLIAAAPLHDIGKAGIPDSILLKRGMLTPAEFDIMKRHTTIGRDILRDVVREIGPCEESDIIRMGMEICSSHHERFDGCGYPAGLSGTAIPLVGRIVTVADFYDALSFPRIYRPFGLPHGEIMGMVRAGAGTQFDPAVVEAFCRREAQVVEIRRRYGGEE